MDTEIIGRRTIIRSNDFVERTLTGRIRAVDSVSDSVLLEFDEPVVVGDATYLFAIASARLERDSLDSMLREGHLSSAVTWIPRGRYNPLQPFDLSWWRGGGAAIADVVLGIVHK
jgi:hypothetical protein